MFNTGLDKKEKDKKEGLFKRLKNIEKAKKKKATKHRFNTTNCL